MAFAGILTGAKELEPAISGVQAESGATTPGDERL